MSMKDNARKETQADFAKFRELAETWKKGHPAISSPMLESDLIHAYKLGASTTIIKLLRDSAQKRDEWFHDELKLMSNCMKATSMACIAIAKNVDRLARKG